MSGDLLSWHARIWESTLGAQEKLVLFAMLSHWSKASGTVFPSAQRLSRLTSLSRRTVLRCLGDLERSGVVGIQRRTGRSSLYRLSLESLPSDQCQPVTGDRESPVPESHPTCDRESLDRCQPVTPPVTESHLEEIQGRDQGRDQGKQALDPRGRIGNLEQALQVPIRERAQFVTDEPHRAEWVQPHRWPEVGALAAKWCDALGWHPPRLGPQQRGVDAVLKQLAAYSSEELSTAIEAARHDRWLNDPKKNLGLSSLSLDVVGRLLNGQRRKVTGHEDANLSTEDVMARRRAERKAKELGLS